MSLTMRKPMSVREFLDWEERQERRFEFDGFQPVAMTGGTIVHSRIQGNLITALNIALRGKPCEVHGSDMKIATARGTRYPDATVLSGPVTADATVIQEPLLVLKVLSPSTSGTDRIVKVREYGAPPPSAATSSWSRRVRPQPSSPGTPAGGPASSPPTTPNWPCRRSTWPSPSPTSTAASTSRQTRTRTGRSDSLPPAGEQRAGVIDPPALTRINAPAPGLRAVCAREGDPMMVQHHNPCFVIADGGHLRLVKPAPDNALHTIEAIDAASVHKKTHDLVSDRAGRSHESVGVVRHAIAPRNDAHELEKTRFAHFIGDTLNERNAAGTFEELILVAPAQILAEIRDKLDTVTEAKVTGTLAKDLTKVPDHELYPHLKQWARPTQRP